MAHKVKKTDQGRTRDTRVGSATRKDRSGKRSTKVSSKNQITIPAAELRAAGLAPGDVLRVEALGAGQVVLTRVDELLGQYAGALDTNGRLRRQVKKLREEW